MSASHNGMLFAFSCARRQFGVQYSQHSDEREIPAICVFDLIVLAREECCRVAVCARVFVVFVFVVVL